MDGEEEAQRTGTVSNEIDGGLLQGHGAVAARAEAERAQGDPKEAHQHLKFHRLVVVREAHSQFFDPCRARQRPCHKARQPRPLLQPAQRKMQYCSAHNLTHPMGWAVSMF